MVVGDQGPLDGGAGHPVVPDAGVEREEPLQDPGPQAGRDAAAVAFEAELVLQRPDDRLDALPEPVRERARLLLVLIGPGGSGPGPGPGRRSTPRFPARTGPCP